MKIRPVGAKVFHADGQTDMTKAIVAFRNFANAPKTVCGKKKFKFHITLSIMSITGTQIQA
jgi:hypothetical protein